ncbi:hypothetical protein scyTo_0018974 [Scyliorhinus torazame]|uniref:Uncharacterized protein n=1 Tax=Scyliorhinus torazame TaxID=75743 RepID=A0A401PPY6_SCYTO|nr:hypothetical protein [Scyliorhinus torazame]
MMAQRQIILHCLLLVCQRTDIEVGRPHNSNAPLLAEETSLAEDSIIQIHLNRLKRNVNQQHECELDIALKNTENCLPDQDLKTHLEKLSYPIQVLFDNGTINITDITVATGFTVMVRPWSMRVKRIILYELRGNGHNPVSPVVLLQRYGCKYGAV